MDASALLQQALVASARVLEASAQQDHGSAVSVFAHLFAGPRRSGRTSLLQAVHDATAATRPSPLATKRANHFHSGGTPSQLMETVLQLERRIEYLKTQPTSAAAGVKRHVLVVTVDDFDVLVALHRMMSGAESASSNADGDDGNAAGAGRFASHSDENEAGGGASKTKSKALRDVWGCLFDYVHSDESSSSSAAELHHQHRFVVLLFAATTATAVVAATPFAGRAKQQQAFVPPASFLDAACAGLWIFPRGLTWQLCAPQIADESSTKPASPLAVAGGAAAATKPTVAALSLPLQTLAERSGCGAAFAELRETIFRFAVHAGVDAQAGIAPSARATALPGAVARALEPPSGVLVYESGGGGGCGRADLVAELGATYARTAFGGALSTLVVEAPLLFGPIFGETEERIRGAFADAYARRPCVLFMHNIEVVAASRGSVLSSSSSAASGNVVQRAIATFLCEADGVDRPDRSSSVLLVGTTARRREMDDAALRPGRLEQHLLLADSLDASEPQKQQQQQQQQSRAATNLGDALSDSVSTFVAAWCETEEERATLEETLRSRNKSGARVPIDFALRAAQQTILQNC